MEEEIHPPPEAGHPPEPVPQTERTPEPEPGALPPPEPPRPVADRVAEEIHALLGQLQQADMRLSALEIQYQETGTQLADTRRAKDQIHGAILALQKVAR